jgi:hypothetical protein
MKPLTKTEKGKLLGKLFWDLNVDTNLIDRLLEGEIEEAGTIRRADVYYRLLTTCGWYKLLKIIPHDKLEDLLDDNVIGKIKSKSLAQKYVYARQFLHR